MTISLVTDTWSIFCIFKYVNSSTSESPNTCHVNRVIDGEEYVIASPTNSAIDRFELKNNKDVKYLPSYIGEKFPNLKELYAERCGLTIVRDHYFKNMKNLQLLYLNGNKITSIESNAFRDLTSVEKLFMHNNMIETFDAKLFATMVSMKEIFLSKNQIKSLSPSTFLIVGGKLAFVDLTSNVCINKNYRSDSNMEHLESNIRDLCKQKKQLESTNGKFTQMFLSFHN